MAEYNRSVKGRKRRFKIRGKYKERNVFKTRGRKGKTNRIY